MNLWVVILVWFFSLSSVLCSDWSCSECSLVGPLLTEFTTNQEALEYQAELLIEAHCPNHESPGECREYMPAYWNEVGKIIFSGFWSNAICGDLECDHQIGIKSQASNLTCFACSNRIENVISMLGFDQTVAGFISALEIWCDGVHSQDQDEAEECREGMQWLIPRAMRTFVDLKQDFSQTFCVENLECRETTQGEDICPSNELRCENKICIPEIYKCDGEDDCGDASDEKNCGNFSSEDSFFSEETSSSWSCSDCSLGSTALISYFISVSSLSEQSTILAGELCPIYPNPAECEDELPEFWPVIAKMVWTGFWPYLCDDLTCPKQQVTGTVSNLTCSACAARINGAAEYFDDDEVISGNTVALNKFCDTSEDTFPDAEDCKEGIQWLLPKALQTIKKQPRDWVDEFCEEEWGCISI